MEDKEIIELYWQRNETAIIKTKEKYDRYLFGIADHILHDTSENEECVNDTYLKVWNSIPPANPTSLKNYAGKIARNHALNRLRDRSREKRVANHIAIHLEELESVVCTKSMVEELMDEYHLEAVINAFLEHLPREKRVMFLRRYWYFDSIKEIAQRMGLSESKVKVTLKRTRDELRKRLEKEGLL